MLSRSTRRRSVAGTPFSRAVLSLRTVPSPAVYALLAAVLWGAAPVLTKRGLNRGAEPQQALVYALAADALVVWVALFWTRGPGVVASIARLDPLVLGAFTATGVLGTAIGRLVGLVGLDRLGASVYSAALSTRPLFATALGVTVLGEHLTPALFLGVLVLVAGLVILERAREHGGGERGLVRRRDLVLPVAAAALYAVSRVVRRAALDTWDVGTLEAVAVNELAGLLVLTAILTAYFGRGLFDVPRSSIPPLVGSGVFIAAGMVAVFTALAAPTGHVVLVDPLVATLPLFTVACAAVGLDTERVTRGVVFGAALVVVGAAIVVR